MRYKSIKAAIKGIDEEIKVIEETKIGTKIRLKKSHYKEHKGLKVVSGNYYWDALLKEVFGYKESYTITGISQNNNFYYLDGKSEAISRYDLINFFEEIKEW